MQKKRHVIIGSSAAGIGVLSKLRKLAPDDEIICLTAQKEMPYNTCLLADFLSEGEQPKAIWTKTQEFFDVNNIQLHRDTPIVSLDSKKKIVTSDDGTTFPYDTLFIGTGMRPISLPVHHPNPHGVFRFHTMNDTLALDAHLRTNKPQSALVIGAGLSGVECADALVERGLSVTVIDAAQHLLPTLIDKEASRVIKGHLTRHDVIFQPNSYVRSLSTDRHGSIDGVILEDGGTIHADMVISALGARPVIGFAHEAGVALEKGGIAVNKYMQTNLPDVYAGGDVAVVADQLNGGMVKSCTWPDAMMHGMLAARAMAGQPKAYPGVTMVLSSVFFDTKFVSCGPVVNPPAKYDIIEHGDTTYHHRYLLQEKVLKGFLLVGHLDHIGTLRRWVTTKQELSNEEIEGLHAQS